MLPILPQDDISPVAATVMDILDAASIASIDEGVYTYIALNANEPKKLLLLLPGFQHHTGFREIDQDVYMDEYNQYNKMSFMARMRRDTSRGQVSLAGHVYLKDAKIHKWDVDSGHYIPTRADGIKFGLPENAYMDSLENEMGPEEPNRKKLRIASLHRL